jgi:hypothetical protein
MWVQKFFFRPKISVFKVHKNINYGVIGCAVSTILPLFCRRIVPSYKILSTLTKMMSTKAKFCKWFINNHEIDCNLGQKCNRELMIWHGESMWVVLLALQIFISEKFQA